MKTIDITIQHISKEYPIHIGSGLLAQLSELLPDTSPSTIYIITDTTVKNLYLEAVTRQISLRFDVPIHSYAFESGEASKHLETVQSVYEDLAKKGVDRKAMIVNLGGGVVTDVGGFIAATYMRGVPFINISTTLEGMVDASIGGKTGVNLGSRKNYVGAFAQPLAVIIDIDTLRTLPERTFLQGYAEVLKHGLVADSELFQDAVRKSPLMMSSQELLDIIDRSIRIKAFIVKEDEHEKAARKLLNFGHTVGHVLESLSFETGHPLYHGEAVAIGMVAESYISQEAGMITQEEYAEIERGIQRVGLPTCYTEEVSIERVIDGLKGDKKNEGGTVKWTLLMGIGVGEFNISISEKFVLRAIEYVTRKQEV